uniref:tRNA-splicing endonuclease subunit Sen2 n=1 Tax=Schizophyllum commune (strain H4-8 / FGSC 9210) TaxID=578458 RepID=D8Q3J3_SCHCM
MSLIGPSTRGRGGGGPGKGGARRADNNRVYGNPLPLLFVEPEPPRRLLERLTPGGILHSLGLRPTEVINPHCEGVFDSATKSVWVTDMRSVLILWQRGFFGKGHLSRSEPSWLARQVNDRRAAAQGKMTSEELTARRRSERKQFKLDRARAIAAAAAEAEAAFKERGEVVVPALSGPNIPSAATWRPSQATGSATENPSARGGPTVAGENMPNPPIEDVEHLQLTLQEAFFLAYALDCLTVYDADTDTALTLQDLWLACQHAHIPSAGNSPIPRQIYLSLELDPSTLSPDNPFLVNYAVYHHYRSLGWVVRGGIKFCADFLLYKKGPVFTHAEFALAVIPSYEAPGERTLNPEDGAPYTWTWLSTINRVNAQVMKTLVLVYVTIPARERLPAGALLGPACLAHYSVREIVVRRFIPARMRDENAR